MSKRTQKSQITYKVPKYSSALYTYWLDSLEESFKLEEASKLQDSSFIEVLASDLNSSRAPVAVYEKMNSLSKMRDNKFKERDSYSVIISPISLIESSRTQKRKRIYHPLLIPASVSSTGTLSPIGQAPFIQRGYLDPASDDNFPIIGTLERAEKFFVKYSNTGFKDLPTLLKYAEEFFKFVSGERYEQFVLPDFETTHGYHIGPFSYQQGSINQLIITLEEVLKGRIL